MTSAELKQALHCHIYSGECSQCPLKGKMLFECEPEVAQAALDYIEKLEQKNNELRLRLQDTKYPFAIGEKAYTIEQTDGMPKVVEREILGVEKLLSYFGECVAVKVKVNENDIDPYGCLYIAIEKYNEDWWTDRDTAENSLKKFIDNINERK